MIFIRPGKHQLRATKMAYSLEFSDTIKSVGGKRSHIFEDTEEKLLNEECDLVRVNFYDLSCLLSQCFLHSRIFWDILRSPVPFSPLLNLLYEQKASEASLNI